VAVKDVEVCFGSGRDVLHSYWGYLSDGGVVIADQAGLEVGDEVALAITIASTGATYRLAGKVVRCEPEADRVTVAFDPGEPHDMLLTEALSEAHNVPPRRHRRFAIDLDVEVSEHGGPPVAARMVNVSEAGCCVRVGCDHRYELERGSRVVITAGDLVTEGEVIWAVGAERGVRLAAGAGDALAWIRYSLGATGATAASFLD
jgi:hypothetical protein